MTKIIQRELYCSNCKENFVQPVYLSVSSFLMSDEEKSDAMTKTRTQVQNQVKKKYGIR